jgi:hypothetical protein
VAYKHKNEMSKLQETLAYPPRGTDAEREAYFRLRLSKEQFAEIRKREDDRCSERAVFDSAGPEETIQ